MPIDERMRPHLTDMRALSTDRFGREVLVGLSHAETEELLSYLAYLETGRRDADHADRQARYLELQDRHELVRCAVLAGENELRISSPARH